MSTGDSKPCRGEGTRRKREAHIVPAGLELNAAQEFELWSRVEGRGEAVQRLTQAKLTSLEGYLNTLDSAPLTAFEMKELARQALQRAIEKPGIDKVLGASLPTAAHEALCQCAGEALQKTKAPAGSSALSPAEWVKTRIPRDPFEEALQVPCDDEDTLWQAICDGREAVELLLLRYKRLALHLARARRGTMPLQDVQSTAMEGLLKAVNNFDPQKQNKFSTFATAVISNEIRTAFRSAPATGSHHARQAAKFERQRQLLVKALGRSPSDAEVCQALGWGELESENFARGKVLLLTQSLDAESRTSRESIEGKRESKPLDKMIRREDYDRLYAALRRLDGRSQHVLRRRFLDEQPLSQRAVGEELGLTREQIRTIEENALKAMERDLEETEHTASHAEQ